MTIEDNKALMRLITEEVNKKNLSILDKYYSNDFDMYAQSGESIKGLDACKQYIASFISAFPDLHTSIDDIIAEGDIVACRHTYTGTHTGSDFLGLAPSGKRFSFSSIVFYHIIDGTVLGGWMVSDSLGLMQQLGMIPSQ